MQIHGELWAYTIGAPGCETGLGSAAMWSGQQLRASGSEVTGARNFLITSLMTFYLFSIFLELLLNISVGHPGPLTVLFSPFCVYDYSLEDRGWDGWMASQSRCTGVWASSRSWWWTGKPGVLACCSLWDRKELDTTEWLNWTELGDFLKFSFHWICHCCNWFEFLRALLWTLNVWMIPFQNISFLCHGWEIFYVANVKSVCVCVCVCVSILAEKFELRNKRLIRCSESRIGTCWFPHYNGAICWGTPKVNFWGCFLSGWWDSLWESFHLLAWEERSGQPVIWELNGRKRLEYLCIKCSVDKVYLYP